VGNTAQSRNYGRANRTYEKEHTMTTIDSTLVSALPVGATSKYPTEYLNVLNALTERDYNLTDQITDVVVREFGVDRDDVRSRLEMAGMAVRPAPAPVVPAFTPEDSAEWEKELTTPAIDAPKAPKAKKDKTAKLVRKLVKAAKRHGIDI
jgi:hypothetical protein